MSNKTIDSFVAVPSGATTDVFIVSQGGVAKKETLAQMDTVLSATTKTLTNKTLTSPKLNEDVALTATSTQLNVAALKYYPDYSAADQGLTGDSDTIKHYVDTIGTTNKATIYLRHNSGSANTDYTFSTNETIPANITVIFEAGARMAVATGITVAILNSPEAPLQQIFSLTGTGKIIGLLKSYPEWFGAVTGGTIDCSPAIQSAIVSAMSLLGGNYRAGTVYFQGGVYLCKSTLTFHPFVNYIGNRGAVANSAADYTIATDSHGTILRAHASLYTDDNNSAGVLVYVYAGDISIENMEFVGTGTINANPSIGVQFGSSSTARTHEGIDTNTSGITMRNVRWVAFTKGWEVFNINDSFAYGYGFESNTTGIQLAGRADGSYVGTLELIGGVIYASSYGIAIGDNINMDFHMIGGLFEGAAALTPAYHLYTGGTRLPLTVGGYSPSFRFDGVMFRHANVLNYNVVLNKVWDGFDGIFQFNDCMFWNGYVYAVRGSGTEKAHGIYFNNPYLKNVLMTFDLVDDIKISNGIFDNSYIEADDITNSKINDNHFKNASGAAVTAITITGVSSNVPITGNTKDSTVTDLISAAASIYRANNIGDADAEGDWTAAFVCGTSGTITLDASWKTGYFIRQGRLVTITGIFQAASVSSPVGTLTITGLPFAASTGGKYGMSVSVAIDGLTADATDPFIEGVISSASQSIGVYKIKAGVASALAGDIKAGSFIFINATYIID